MIESPDIIERLKILIEAGGGFMALFDKALVSRSRALELIEVLEESLPEEMDMAKDVLERQEEILEQARQQAGEIVDEAVRKAEKLVDADVITAEAREVAESIRADSDTYVGDRLVQLEVELSRILSEVRAGIRSMGVNPDKTGAEGNPVDLSLDRD